MKRHALAALLFSAGIAALPALAKPPTPPLPAMGADLSATTVSGISSGGFMAAQLATAYSARFVGVGVIAAGPYYCAGTYPSLSMFQNATTSCMTPAIAATAANGATSFANARRFAAEGLIDPVQNLTRQRVYAFSGAGDRTVKTIVVDQVEQYYRLAGVPPERILYRKHPEAGHSIVIDDDDDVPCATTAPPYINNCGFIQSHELLAHLYGPGKPANTGVPAGQIIVFDQREFIKGSQTSMNANGYAYVPRYCTTNACNVHVAFHGCQQGAHVIGDQFYRGTGYNEYADTNRLIILYPQAGVSKGMPVNPQGCWDFWGYSNTPGFPPFYAKGAPQMAAVMAMIDRLGQPRGAANAAPAGNPQP
ncbi:esterase/PHB depolymerase [Pseudoduganella flava]|nr:poly(3-hydroxybutyrate) depolymerase [Pseudoduganella flava]TWI42432.1 esterase/PHB depolymerase [Pseudoduganella flava]